MYVRVHMCVRIVRAIHKLILSLAARISPHIKHTSWGLKLYGAQVENNSNYHRVTFTEFRLQLLLSCQLAYTRADAYTFGY